MHIFDPANIPSIQTTVYCILAHTHIRNNPNPGHASKSNAESCRGNVLNKDCETFPLHVQMMKQESLHSPSMKLKCDVLRNANLTSHLSSDAEKER